MSDTEQYGYWFEGPEEIEAIVNAMSKSDPTMQQIYRDMVYEQVHKFDELSDQFWLASTSAIEAMATLKETGDPAAYNAALQLQNEASEAMQELPMIAAKLSIGGSTVHREQLDLMVAQYEKSGAAVSARPTSGHGKTGGCGSVLLLIVTFLLLSVMVSSYLV